MGIRCSFRRIISELCTDYLIAFSRKNEVLDEKGKKRGGDGGCKENIPDRKTPQK